MTIADRIVIIEYPSSTTIYFMTRFILIVVFLLTTMDIAISSTEAYLERKWRDNPIVEPSLLNSVWKSGIKSAISGQFGSSASVTTSCSGVRNTPAFWNC